MGWKVWRRDVIGRLYEHFICTLPDLGAVKGGACQAHDPVDLWNLYRGMGPAGREHSIRQSRTGCGNEDVPVEYSELLRMFGKREEAESPDAYVRERCLPASNQIAASSRPGVTHPSGGWACAGGGGCALLQTGHFLFRLGTAQETAWLMGLFVVDQLTAGRSGKGCWRCQAAGARKEGWRRGACAVANGTPHTDRCLPSLCGRLDLLYAIIWGAVQH